MYTVDMNDMNGMTTTITVSKANRDKLASRGKKDESFDEIIGRLLKETKKEANA